MAIIQMLLWELQPKTIIEIGSGNGSSAEYMKDIMAMYNVDCKIFSFDIRNKDQGISDNTINFLHCDCNDVQTLNKIDYTVLPHPWLIVEDSHVNVFGVLEFLNTFSSEGDYFYVEDIDFRKRIDLEKFLKLDNFKLDLKYLNYFGKNMTCAKNGIFKKMALEA
jgi:cephalosporin hydroxylase